jgi:uncharacterized protein
MNIFLLCAAILVIFYAVLSANVSRARRRQREFPQSTDAELTKAIRAHGNASEYLPLFVAIFLYLPSVQSGPFAATIAVTATLSRILHAAGMLIVASVAERHPLRFCGALGTYICLFALGCMIMMHAF